LQAVEKPIVAIEASRPAPQGGWMIYLFIKAALSGVIVALVSEIARRNPGAGGLLASLPLVSVLGMIWLWRDTQDAVRMAAHAEATFWFVLPSLPMFLLIPGLLRSGVGFWAALAAGCLLTIALYAGMIAIGPKLGIRL
jgi:hypothetical protein